MIGIIVLLRPGHVEAVSLPPDVDAWHPIESDQYGEGWYFDAEFTNGYFFSGSIMIFGNISNDAVVQVKFMISPPDRDSVLVFQSYSMEDFQASQNECNVSVGNNRVSGVWPYYSLFLSNGTIAVSLSYVAKVEGWKGGSIKGYSWIVPVPRAYVSGQIIIGEDSIYVKGEGYHDHILEDGSLKGVYGWYWGRIFDGKFTIVWSQIMLSREAPLVGLGMIADGEEVIGDSMNLQLLPRKYIYDNSTQTYIPVTYELRCTTLESFGYPVWLHLKMRLSEQGILIGMRDNYFQKNCTLYRLRIQTDGILRMGPSPARIESIGMMEFMKFRQT